MNIMTDFAFKRLFGTPERKNILIRFLNIIFAKDNLKIEDVRYHDKEVLPEDEDGKRIVYDVYCTTPNDKEHIIMEMQQVYHTFFENRTALYATKALSGQLKRGDKYMDIKPVYSIFLVDFHFPHMMRKGIHDVRLMDIHSHEIYTDILRLLFIHLSDIKDNWNECKTEYEKFTFLIKNMHHMDKNSEAYKSGEYKYLFDEAEINNMAAEDIVAYSQSSQKYYDNLAAIDYAAQNSFSKGIEKGIEKVATTLKRMGESVARIQAATGLTPEQIEALK